MKSLSLAVALVLILLLSSSYLQVTMVAADDCNTKCQKRCSLKVAGRCMGLCMMCCGKCNGCVPDGPRASKDACPCYRDMTSPKSGRPKCP